VHRPSVRVETSVNRDGIAQSIPFEAWTRMMQDPDADIDEKLNSCLTIECEASSMCLRIPVMFVEYLTLAKVQEIMVPCMAMMDGKLDMFRDMISFSLTQTLAVRWMHYDHVLEFSYNQTEGFETHLSMSWSMSYKHQEHILDKIVNFWLESSILFLEHMVSAPTP
jgi:hypothetical protein